jgi:hypothetical protein
MLQDIKNKGSKNRKIEMNKHVKDNPFFTLILNTYKFTSIKEEDTVEHVEINRLIVFSIKVHSDTKKVNTYDFT